MMPLLHRKEKVYRATVCHLTNLTDDELRARYRFGQDSINFIANLLREDLVRFNVTIKFNGALMNLTTALVLTTS
jgi:hypothetical protein